MNNVLANNTQGIGLDDSYYIEVIGNDIIGNYHRGVMLGNLHYGTITQNNFVNNNIGIWILQFFLTENRIYHNNFINNSQQIAIHAIQNPFEWDAGYPSGGNYWSDYSGWDANNDGIGDSPYVIDESNQDRYPLMSPYGSPPLPMYTLTIAATVGGTTNPAPGNYTHSKGQNISVNATPSTGYLFDRWELDDVNIGTSNPVYVTMNANHTLHAVFALAYTLTIETTAGGTTNPTSGTYTYAAGTVVTVTARPNIGYYFDCWELDGVNHTDNPISVTMNMSHTLKAFFVQISYTLTVTTTEGGTTNPAPGTYIYWLGTTITIAALPDTGYYLDHWELDGVDIGISNPVNVTMNANHTLHAAFKQLSSGHDVTIKGITSKTVVGQGYFVTVQVTAMNIGSYPETFNVTSYVNATPIASRLITIESGMGITLTFTWNTTSYAKGNYTISAAADPIPDEADTDNNNVTGWVIVAMI